MRTRAPCSKTSIEGIQHCPFHSGAEMHDHSSLQRPFSEIAKPHHVFDTRHLASILSARRQQIQPKAKYQKGLYCDVVVTIFVINF